MIIFKCDICKKKMKISSKELLLKYYNNPNKIYKKNYKIAFIKSKYRILCKVCQDKRDI